LVLAALAALAALGEALLVELPDRLVWTVRQVPTVESRPLTR